jgi:HEAT repeat protein
MPIVPSRSRRMQELLHRLASPAPPEREAAVAGLTLLGPRVVEPLRAFLPTADRAARLGALEVLDRLDDRAALPLILDLARGGDEAVALRALDAAGGRADERAVPGLAALLGAGTPAPRRRAAARALVRLQARGLVEALDVLAARLLDEREEAGLRVSILRDLLALDPPLALSALRPLLKRLAASAEPELAALAAGGASPSRPSVDDRLVADLVAPGQPAAVVARIAAALARRGASAIPSLLRALEDLGPGRPGRPDAAALRARAAVHEALAACDSRAALYDLRETIERGSRAAMPALLRAAGRIGDASIVPALAAAVAEDAGLLEPCAEALAAIVAREKLPKPRGSRLRPEHRAAYDRLWERAKARRPR